MIEFTLPLPCSVNGLYTVAKGRKILSKKGRMWNHDSFYSLKKRILDAEEACKEYLVPIITAVSISYHFVFPDHRKRDISNYIKQVEDIIVSVGIIKDDSLVMAFSATKTIEKGKREVRVFIEEISESEPL